MRNFLIAVIKGFLFVTILTIGSVAGLFKGIWDESDRLARLWLMQLMRSGRSSGAMDNSLYWIIRMFAFVLQIAFLIVIFGWLGSFIRRIVGF